MGRAHLRENLIEPLQGPVQVHLNPAGCACHVLPVILCPPALDKAHADGAHLRELEDSFEAMVDRLAEELRELLVVEDLEAAAGRDLADGGGVEVVVVVALTALHEDAAVAETLRKHLASHVVQVHTCKEGVK